MYFDNATANSLLAYGLANQTQHIDYAHDYSRIRLSPFWYPNTWNLSTGYESAINTNHRVYDFGNIGELLNSICSVTDLTDIIDSSNITARDLNDEDIIAEDIGNLIE